MPGTDFSELNRSFPIEQGIQIPCSIPDGPISSYPLKSLL